MKKYVFYILVPLLLIACKDQSKKGAIYFGGEIINPKSNWVFLMKNEKIIDSLSLSKEHTFGKSFTDLNPGLYYFKHGYEYQYLFLEPNDSIFIRLNTWDFDETLVFDGKGADKNELLIKLFLANERETNNFFSYFSLDEIAFEEKIDDILARHNRMLDKLIESNQQLSEEFLHLIRGVINYPIYRLKEIYPYYHNRSLNSDSIYVPSEGFYSFRSEMIDLNDAELSEYYGYQNYVNSYLYNIAFQENKSKKFDNNFRKILLDKITEKIHLQDLKNRLLYQEVNYMLFNESCKIDAENLSVFFENSTDSIAKTRVKQLLYDKKLLPNNCTFPGFDLVSISGDSTSINQLINGKKSVVYFWSSDYSSNEYIGKRIYYLAKKYPELFFVGINISEEAASKPYSIKKLDNQYTLTKNSKGKTLVSSQYPRAILINADGKVVNNFTLLTNSRIEKQLQQLITQE